MCVCLASWLPVVTTSLAENRLKSVTFRRITITHVSSSTSVTMKVILNYLQGAFTWGDLVLVVSFEIIGEDTENIAIGAGNLLVRTWAMFVK